MSRAQTTARVQVIHSSGVLRSALVALLERERFQVTGASGFSRASSTGAPGTPGAPATVTVVDGSCPVGAAHLERRRIALARAWLTPTPLLLLDEPTAHLDAGARAATELAFASHPATVITVSHHFPAPEPGQRVLLLDGATPYLGTHASLLRESALYGELAAGLGEPSAMGSRGTAST